LAISAPFTANSVETKQLLTELGCDPVYIKLCENQVCFRARLSPKPWRIGCAQPPTRFPFESADAERQYREWVIQYETQSRSFGVCAVIGDFGLTETRADIEPILQLHEHYTCLNGESLA
jgi:hypothetical protein